MSEYVSGPADVAERAQQMMRAYLALAKDGEFAISGGFGTPHGGGERVHMIVIEIADKKYPFTFLEVGLVVLALLVLSKELPGKASDQARHLALSIAQVGNELLEQHPDVKGVTLQ